MTKREHKLNDIHYLILCVLAKHKKSPGAVELAKIVYLVDYEYYKLFGEQYTNLAYERYPKGPYDKEIGMARGELEALGFIKQKTERPGFSGIPKKAQLLLKDVEPEKELSPEAVHVIKQVLRKVRGLTPIQIENLAYKTEPMVKILEKENKANRKLDREPLNFSLIKRDSFMKRWLANREKLKKNPEKEYEAYLEKERESLSLQVKGVR